MAYDPPTARLRYNVTHRGHGNAEPHDEPARVWTAADFAEFNAGNDRARESYYAADVTRERQRALKRALDQQRYRDRTKP